MAQRLFWCGIGCYLSVASITSATVIEIAASGDDGFCQSYTSTSWPTTCEDCQLGTLANQSPRRQKVFSKFVNYNAFFRFDVSGQSFSAASFQLEIGQVLNQDGLRYECEYWPAWTGTLTCAHYSHDSNGSAFSVPISEIVPWSINTFALQDPTANVVNGWLTLRCHISQLPDDAQPGGWNNLHMWWSDYTYGDRVTPRLILEDAEPTPTASPTPVCTCVCE